MKLQIENIIQRMAW